MSFVNIIALSALSFLAVPILIQFFINRRKIVLNWAAFEWMKKAKIVKRKKVKVDEILKLIAKLLLILLLVLFAARPTLKSASSHIAIVIDNSPSMGTNYEDGQRLDAARKIALEIIKVNHGKVSVFSFGDSLVPVIKNTEASNVSESVMRKITLVPGSAGPEKLLSALNSEIQLNEANTIYFISDFQKSNYKEDKYISEAQSFLRGKKLIFVPVDQRTGVLNIGIESVSQTKEGFYPGRFNYVDVVIKNYSSLPAESVQVFLSVNGEKKDMITLNLAPYEKLQVKMGAFFPEADEFECEVSLPPDALSFDNDYKFVFYPGKKVNILSVVRDSSEDEFPPDLFFKSALISACGNEYINYRTVKKLDALSENINNQDMLLIFGIPFNKKDNFYNSVNEFCKEEKSLICFSDLSVEDYFSAFDIETNKVISEFKTLDPLRLSGTYFEFIATEKLDPSTITMFRYFSFKNTRTVSDGGRFFVNDIPDALMISKKIGRTNAIFAGFMPYKSYTNIFYNPNFVQFTMRVFSEALNRKIFYAFTGFETERLPTGAMFFDSDWKIKRNNIEERPEPKKDSRGTYLYMKASLESKFWTLFADEIKVYPFAVNCPRNDSEVESIQAAAMKEVEKAGIGLIYKTETLSQKMQQSEFGIIMTILLSLVLFFDLYAHFIRKRG